MLVCLLLLKLGGGEIETLGSADCYTKSLMFFISDFIVKSRSSTKRYLKYASVRYRSTNFTFLLYISLSKVKFDFFIYSTFVFKSILVSNNKLSSSSAYTVFACFRSRLIFYCVSFLLFSSFCMAWSIVSNSL